jgi:hypothetical protein
MENKVSAVLTDTDVADILKAFETIRTKLPFLVDVSPEERRTLPKMGDKSRAFVEQANELAKRDDSALPRSFSVEEFTLDVELIHQLAPIIAACAQLHELLEDTNLVIGSDAYVAALIVYQYTSKGSGGSEGGGLDDLLDAMGKRFARRAKQIADVPPAG